MFKKWRDLTKEGHLHPLEERRETKRIVPKDRTSGRFNQRAIYKACLLIILNLYNLMYDLPAGTQTFPERLLIAGKNQGIL